MPFLVAVIVVFVTQNMVCNRTVRLASFFAKRETDEIHIVTSVVGDQHISKASDFLKSFQVEDLPRKCFLKQSVLMRGQGKVIYVHLESQEIKHFRFWTSWKRM